MKATYINLNQVTPAVSKTNKKVQKLIEEFDFSNAEACKISLDPGDYKNLHSAYSIFHAAVVRLHRDKSIQVRSSSAESCLYLIRVDISKGGMAPR